MLAFLWTMIVLQDTAKTSIPADSYADEATRTLVTQARAARERNEKLVTGYQASVTQRIGVGLKAASRDRMLYRQELAAKIEWKRDAQSKIEVIGAREGVPVAIKGDRLPEDLDDQLRWLVINPAEDYLRLAGMDDDDGFTYPLRNGGERDYKFAIGDTTAIGLPSGRRVRIVELEVTPRRSDWRLISGSLWFDADTYGLVRAVFRPARPFEFRRDSDAADREDVPEWVNPTGEVKFVTLEYGLYEDRWWMLRYLAMDAVGNVGAWLGIPFRMERVYADYEVEGGTPAPAGSTFRPAGTIRRDSQPAGLPVDSAVRVARRDSVRAAVRQCIKEAEQAETAGRGEERRRAVRVRVRNCTRTRESDSVLAVVIPPDSAALVTSAALGPPILEMGDLISEAEIKGLSDAIGRIPASPWDARVNLPRGVSSLLEKARYNRIEGLSLALRGNADFGRLTIDGSARIGVADRWPNVEGGLAGNGLGGRWRVAGYRRLAAANPEIKPFGAINSTFAFFGQRDDGEYYRATGAELTGRNGSGSVTWRAYAESQRAAVRETDFSLPHVFNGDRAFRPNIGADTADQFGIAFAVRGSKPLSASVAVGAELNGEAATGDFEFGKGSVTVRALVTPKGPVSFATAFSAGASRGAVPLQHRFFLGGPPPLRPWPSRRSRASRSGGRGGPAATQASAGARASGGRPPRDTVGRGARRRRLSPTPLRRGG